jgi:hypothetical protein
MVALVAAALSLRAPQEPAARSAPSPAAIFLVVLALGLPWWLLLVIEFSNQPVLSMVPFMVPMIGGIAWGTLALMLIRRWSSSASWNAMHRYACVFAAMLVCMTGGALSASSWLRVDQIAQIVFDAGAIGGMIALGMSLAKPARKKPRSKFGRPQLEGALDFLFLNRQKARVPAGAGRRCAAPSVA